MRERERERGVIYVQSVPKGKPKERRERKRQNREEKGGGDHWAEKAEARQISRRRIMFIPPNTSLESLRTIYVGC